MVFSERIDRALQEATTQEALTAIQLLKEAFQTYLRAGLVHEVPRDFLEKLTQLTQEPVNEVVFDYKQFTQTASAKEYQLFVTLFNYLNSPNNELGCCTHYELASTVWGEELPDDIEGSVNKLVQRTRERMEKAGVPFTIKSKKGMGYYLLNTRVP